MKVNILLLGFILLSYNMSAQEKSKVISVSSGDNVARMIPVCAQNNDTVRWPTVTSLIFIDGKEGSLNDAKEIATEIKRISVVPSVSFITKIGEKRDDVLVINTKEDTPYFHIEIPLKNIKTVEYGYRPIRGVVIVNQKPMPFDESGTSSKLKSIIVSHSEENIAKYGDATKSGVVVIKTK